MERALMIIKPDGSDYGQQFTFDLASRLLNIGIINNRLLTMRLTTEQAEEFYKEHEGKWFHQRLIEHMTSGLIHVSILEGEGVIQKWRDLMGPTDPKVAPKGTIRGDYGTELPKNVVHGSDSVESAEREIRFFFGSGII